MHTTLMVTRSSMPTLDEYIDEIKSIWDTHWLTNMGEKHQQLQAILKTYLRVNHIELFTNGHMALELSFQALGLNQGEVITTPFTFSSTTHAIVRNGLTPVFCDIDPITFTIDTNLLESMITERTVAILPVHVYGNVCDVKKIDEIAKKFGLKVIYDAAHAFGELYNGKGIGSFGDISCFSFHATKVFNTIEGGAVCYKDKNLGINLYRLKNFGICGPESVECVGTNAKMNEFCAAMGICNLRHIDSEIKKRRAIAERYRKRLKDVKGIQLNALQADVKCNYAYFPIIFNEKIFGNSRDTVMKKLEENGIGSRKYFFPLTSDLKCYRENYNSGNTPVASYISDHVLTVPLYADLALEDVDRICDIILSLC